MLYIRLAFGHLPSALLLHRPDDPKGADDRHTGQRRQRYGKLLRLVVAPFHTARRRYRHEGYHIRRANLICECFVDKRRQLPGYAPALLPFKRPDRFADGKVVDGESAGFIKFGTVSPAVPADIDIVDRRAAADRADRLFNALDRDKTFVTNRFIN